MVTAQDDTPLTKLNIGCGWDKRAGYLNIDLQDFHEPDLVADVRDLGALPSGQYEEILAIDVLEHLPRSDCGVALNEWSRLLRDGGILRLQVPDIIGLARLCVVKAVIEDQRVLIQNLYGTQAYTGDWHQNGFTELLLRAELHDAGFETVSLNHRDGWLFECVARKSSHLGPFDPGALPFMRLAGTEDLQATTSQSTEGDIKDLLAVAAAHAHAGENVDDEDRLVFVKRLLVRVGRMFTHHQRAYNEAVLEVLRRTTSRSG